MNKLNLFIKITILFVIFSFFFKVYSKLINKSKFHLIKFNKSRVIKTNNCTIKKINKIPKESTIVIGHLYGSPEFHNDFIDKKAEKFLIDNQSVIKNLFLTGDVFVTPSKKKWNKLFTLLGDHMNIIIAPGNHDVGNLRDQLIFNSATKQNNVFPIEYKDLNNIFLFENSFASGWHINENIFSKINKTNKNKNLFLLRHNIGVKELTLLANSRAGLKKGLPNFNQINSALKRDITVISGDGGAFKSLPRIFCKKNGKVRYIINGLGGVKDDSILIIHNKQIFKYTLN